MILLFQQGGWVMYPLLAFSIISLSVILERAFFYYFTRQNLDLFLSELLAWRGKNKNEPLYSCPKELSEVKKGLYLSRMFSAYLSCLHDEENTFEEKIFIEGSLINKSNEKRLPVLSTIASLSPLVGLFGTVLGMIEVFRKLESIGGRADVTLLSGGIWVALITTAFGLLIAVPSLITHHYFLGVASERYENLQFLVSHLNIITGRSAKLGTENQGNNGEGNGNETLLKA